MKKNLVLFLILLTSCGKQLSDKEICDGNWQFMSDGMRQKCSNDRLTDAMKDMHTPIIIRDTIYIYK